MIVFLLVRSNPRHHQPSDRQLYLLPTMVATKLQAASKASMPPSSPQAVQHMLICSEAPAFKLPIPLVAILELDPQLPDPHLWQDVRDPLDLKGGDAALVGRPAAHLQWV